MSEHTWQPYDEAFKGQAARHSMNPQESLHRSTGSEQVMAGHRLETIPAAIHLCLHFAE